MKQLLFLIVFCPILVSAQVQIGQDIDGENSGDQLGWSISLSASGNIIAIGAPTNSTNGAASGQVRVFENQSGNWVQIGNGISGESVADQSGISVSLSSNGNILAVGAPRNDGNGNDSGHVRVYENISGTWTQIGNDIDGEALFNRFGTSVSISNDGSILAVGAPFNSNINTASGHVRVFENQSGNWIQIGEDIDGEGADDFSGTAVSLSANGNIVAIGAPNNNGNGNDSGHVRVYENVSDVWTQIGADIDGEAPNDQSGSVVGLSSDGRIVAIGATFGDGNNINTGEVRVLRNQSGSWQQIGNIIVGEFTGDLSGWSLSLSSDGKVLAVSEPGNDSSRGRVRIYENQSDNWVQVGIDINGESIGDFYGRSVNLSVDGQTVAIGANRNTNDAGHVRVFDLSNILSSDEFVLNNFSLYPNPARDQFTIGLNGIIELEQINIYNNLGQFLFSSTEKRVDTSTLSTGLYLVEIRTNQGKATKKLVIE